ncbi:integrase catalytic domain-containing protein [Pycnococcus provasolii]
MASEGDTGAGGTHQEHTPQPTGSGSFHHGTGSAGEQRPEQPLLNDEEREDLVVIAQNSPLASQRLSARRALLDDATLRHQQMEETTTATASSPGMRVLAVIPSPTSADNASSVQDEQERRHEGDIARRLLRDHSLQRRTGSSSEVVIEATLLESSSDKQKSLSPSLEARSDLINYVGYTTRARSFGAASRLRVVGGVLVTQRRTARRAGCRGRTMLGRGRDTSNIRDALTMDSSEANRFEQFYRELQCSILDTGGAFGFDAMFARMDFPSDVTSTSSSGENSFHALYNPALPFVKQAFYNSTEFGDSGLPFAFFERAYDENTVSADVEGALFDVYIDGTLMEDRAKLLLSYLQASRFVDQRTRFVDFRFLLHNVPEEVLADVRVRISIDAHGRISTEADVWKLSLFDYFGTARRAAWFAVELLVAAFAIALCVSSIGDMRQFLHLLHASLIRRLQGRIVRRHFLLDAWTIVVDVLKLAIPLSMLSASIVRFVFFFGHVRNFTYERNYRWYDGDGSAAARILLPKRLAGPQPPLVGYPRGAFRHTMTSDFSDRDAYLQLLDRVDDMHVLTSPRRSKLTLNISCALVERGGAHASARGPQGAGGARSRASFPRTALPAGTPRPAVRSSTADNIKNGNGTAFETVQKNLEDVLNATRGDRLARIDEGTVGKGKFPEKSIDDLPPPAKPQCTGNAGDFPIFKGALDTYLAHYQLLSFTIADSDPTKNSRAATALRIIKESVATTQPFGKHVKLAPAVDRTQLERVVHAAHNAKSAYDAVLTFFRHNVTAARKQNLTTRFHRCKQGTNSVAIYLRELQGHVLEMRRCGIDISDEAAIIQLIQNAQPDLKTRAKLSRRLIGDDLAEVIRDLLDDADISDTDEDPRKRSMLDAPPRRNPRRPGNRTYLTSAERLYRAYRVDMRGRQDEGKFPAPGKSLPHKQRAFRVERTPPPPEVPPNDDEEEEQRLDGTDNAGHASDGGHATTDGEDDWEAFRRSVNHFALAHKRPPIWPLSPPARRRRSSSRIAFFGRRATDATGDKSIFVGKLQSSGATLEGVNPTPVEPLVGSVEFQLHTPEGRTGTIRTKMFYVEGLPVTILSEHGTREEHAHTFEGPSDAQPTVTVLDRMATVMADFNRPEQPSWSIRFKTCMMKLDEMHVTEINNITSRQETPWHGTMMPAPGADRRGRSYRNSRTYSGKTHKPRSQKFADTMHAAPRKYVGRRFRSIFSEDDGAVTHGEGIIIDYDANTGWWRGRYDDDVEGLNVQEEDFNARELLRWTAEYDAAHDTHELVRGWFNIPGHEEYATTLEWYRQLEADVAHEFTHEACGRNDGQNVRAKSHGSPRNPFENWKPRSPQTLPDDADYENVLLNPEYSQAQKFLDLARQKHANHTGVGFTGPLKWPVLILRLDPMLGDATVGVEPHHDMEYGLPGDRAACKSHVHLTVREQTNLITHCKHGHKGPAVLEEMLRQGLISKKEYYPNAAIPYCEACATGGMRKRDDRIRHHEHVSPQPAPGEVLVVDHIPLSTPGIDGIICSSRSTNVRGTSSRDLEVPGRYGDGIPGGGGLLACTTPHGSRHQIRPRQQLDKRQA